jgi:peptidoglycan L-alanyl-D-glutamate endopeptidase CwlK
MSRNPLELTEEARTAWEKSKGDYKSKYQDDPQPFLTCTYRSNALQAELYAQGRTRPGKIVTNAKPGQSNHNKYPSPAFDIAFKDSNGVCWELSYFFKFAQIGKKHGLSWGGDWKRFKDYPHFEVSG